VYPKLISILDKKDDRMLETLKHNLSVSDPIYNSRKEQFFKLMNILDFDARVRDMSAGPTKKDEKVA